MHVKQNRKSNVQRKKDVYSVYAGFDYLLNFG